MDAYLDSLYLHFLENRLDEYLRASTAHQLLCQRRDEAWNALAAGFTPEQTTALDTFFCATSAVCAEEARLVFQEAIQLGKWMAR